MSTSKRRQFTPDEKAAIVRQHLIEKVEISALCEQHDIQPSLYYLWRNQLFEHAARALQDRRATGHDPQQQALEAERRKVAQLEARLAHKDRVIAQLAEENIGLKGEDGGT
jgi:transposase